MSVFAETIEVRGRTFWVGQAVEVELSDGTRVPTRVEPFPPVASPALRECYVRVAWQDAYFPVWLVHPAGALA